MEKVCKGKVKQYLNNDKDKKVCIEIKISGKNLNKDEKLYLYDIVRNHLLSEVYCFLEDEDLNEE